MASPKTPSSPWKKNSLRETPKKGSPYYEIPFWRLNLVSQISIENPEEKRRQLEKSMKNVNWKFFGGGNISLGYEIGELLFDRIGVTEDNDGGMVHFQKASLGVFRIFVFSLSDGVLCDLPLLSKQCIYRMSFHFLTSHHTEYYVFPQFW